MAIKASFSPSALLSEFGDSLDNRIVTSRDAAGNILVNGGAVSVEGGQPTVANTALIQVFGQGGNDTITLDESNGALPAAQLVGGAGNDVLTGGSGGDLLFGQSGNDTLLGKGGNDQLFGGAGNDVLTGGDGDDQMFGEAGNDRMIWNPGDDDDLMEGGDGNDTAEVNGGNGAETFTITANGTRVRFDRVAPAPFFLDIGTTENLVVNAGGGDDMISASGNLASLIKLTIDGGAGNDTILGGNGNDTLIGGDGNDFIDGNQGSDVALLGAGDDVFQWDPGDGSDVVDGQDGTDTLLFNGANVAETMSISANHGKVSFVRDIANITMDLDNIEDIQVNALGDADKITVNDLTGTDVTLVTVDLGANDGAADGAADQVNVNGTNGNDQINVAATATDVAVTGLPEQVNIDHADAGDVLTIKGGNGDDVISASGNLASLIKLTIDGGAGNDTILGGNGNDTLIGGDGNDFVDGNQGSDVRLPIWTASTTCARSRRAGTRCGQTDAFEGCRPPTERNGEIEHLDQLSRAELRELWKRELAEQPPARTRHSGARHCLCATGTALRWPLQAGPRNSTGCSPVRSATATIRSRRSLDWRVDHQAIRQHLSERGRRHRARGCHI